MVRGMISSQIVCYDGRTLSPQIKLWLNSKRADLDFFFNRTSKSSWQIGGNWLLDGIHIYSVGGYYITKYWITQVVTVRLGALHGADSRRESLPGCQTVFSEWSDSLLILWSDSLKWTKRLRAEKRVVSPDYVKWFFIIILRVYAKKSKRITFSQESLLLKNQFP